MELILAETSHKVNCQEAIVEILSSQLKSLTNLLKTERSKLEEAKKEERKGAKLVADLVAWLSGKGSEDFDSIIEYLSNIKPQQGAKSPPEPRIIEIEIEIEEEFSPPETTLEAEAAKAYEDICGFPPRTSDHAEQKPFADTTPRLVEGLIVEAPQETKNRRGKTKASKQLTLPLSVPNPVNELESQATTALQAIGAKIKELAPDLLITHTSDQKSNFLVMTHKDSVVGRIEDDGSDVYISGKKTMKEYGFTDEQINWLLEADTRPKL